MNNPQTSTTGASQAVSVTPAASAVAVKAKPRRRGALREIWAEYRRSPQGMLGLFIFMVFLFLGLAAPWLTPYDPLQDQFLAERMARPGWMSYFPAYRNAPAEGL